MGTAKRLGFPSAWAISTILGTAAATAAGPQPEPIREEPLLIGELGVAVETGDPYVTAAFLAQPNLRGIATAPTVISYRAPSGRSFAFRLRRFDASEGITVSDDGEVVVDPDPSRLSYYWYGGDAYGSVSIGVSRGVMHATITGPLDRLALVRDRDGNDVLQSLDVNALNRVRCLTGSATTVPVALSPGKNVREPLSPSDASVERETSVRDRSKYAVEIGIVFLYTPAALAAASASGNPLDLIPRVDTAIAELQAALQNAGQSLQVRVRRVGPATAEASPRIGLLPITYSETPGQPNVAFRFLAHRKFLLDNFDNDENTADGIDILSAREDFGGDLVIMLIADQGEPDGQGDFLGPFGIAMAQRRNCDENGQLINRECNIGPAYKDFAFAAVSVQRLSTDYTFAHEAGHMLGSEHDRRGVLGIDFKDWTTAPAPSDVIASFASSYGYRAPGSGGTTARSDVMASPLCLPQTSTTNCWTRDLQFSDPGRTFLTGSGAAGQPTPTSPNQGYGFNSLSFRQLAEDTAAFYGGAIVRPLFWDGFE